MPDPVDLVPGETVLFHFVNGGLEIHEAVIGDAAVQDAWEAAEAATVGHPPGPTPVVSVPPAVAGPARRPRLRPAGRRRVDGAARRGRRCPPADRLPHPRPLGEGDGRSGPIRAAITRPVSVPVVRFWPAPESGRLGRGEGQDDLCDRRAVHRCARHLVRLGLPGGLHPLRRGRRPEALHRPQRMHRLRRLRARVPGQRDLPGGVAAARVGPVHGHRRHLVHGQGCGQGGRRTRKSRASRLRLRVATAEARRAWPRVSYENRFPPAVGDRDRRCPWAGRRARRDHPRMRLAAGDCRDAGDDTERLRPRDVEQLRHPSARQRRGPRRVVALRARRGGARGGPARSDPDPGAVPGVRRQLSARSTRSPARSTPTSRSSRSSRRRSRASSTRSRPSAR